MQSSHLISLVTETEIDITVTLIDGFLRDAERAAVPERGRWLALEDSVEASVKNYYVFKNGTLPLLNDITHHTDTELRLHL
jgi:hypothetical protein